MTVSVSVEAGQVWTDNLTEARYPTRIIVRRVARDGSWADIRVEQHTGARWGKRMRLPFPSAWEKLR